MKNAKKSMFITTILMVAVLIVAVSTATFAWYTASNSADANTATLISAQSNAANIAVGFAADSQGREITFGATAAEVSPMCPTAVPVIGTTVYSGDGAMAFNTATLAANGTFGTNGSAAGATPWVVNGEGCQDAKFYIINHNLNAATTVTMTCAVDEAKENSDKLVIAVFVDNVLAGIFAPDSQFVAGTITSGSSPESLTTVENPDDGDKIIVDSITIELAAATASTPAAKSIQVRAWLDGTALTQSFADKEAGFSFHFSATDAPAQD